MHAACLCRCPCFALQDRACRSSLVLLLSACFLTLLPPLPRCRDFGRLGTGDCKDVFVPCPLPSLAGRTVASVACGDTHTLVATDDGQLFSFGRNQSGQLGLGSIQDSLLPQPVLALQVGSGHSWLG